jgi:hypothetical protein
MKQERSESGDGRMQQQQVPATKGLTSSRLTKINQTLVFIAIS